MLVAPTGVGGTLQMLAIMLLLCLSPMFTWLAQRFSIEPKYNHMRQRIEAKKKNYPYWFSSAALPARRLWRIPVDAQTVPRINRPVEKMTLLRIRRSDIFILFHLQNTSFFLGFSRMPLSSAAMATIPLQKDVNL